MKNEALPSELRYVISVLHKRLRKQFYTTEIFSMTEIETLGYLVREEASSLSELAALTKVKMPSMSQIINKLEEHKIIKRADAKEDKRKKIITLTALGKKMIAKTRYDRDAWLNDAINTSCTEQEKALLLRALVPLKKIAQYE